MTKILKFKVEEGGTLSCKECPLSVKRYDAHCEEEYEYVCNTDKNPFNCGIYDLTTLELIGEEDE